MRERPGAVIVLMGQRGGVLRTSQGGDLDILHGIIGALMVGETLASEVEEEGKGGGNSRLNQEISNGQSSGRRKCNKTGEELTSQ